MISDSQNINHRPNSKNCIVAGGLERRPATGLSIVRFPLRKTFRFGTLAIPFTRFCQCLSEDTVKAVGPCYLLSMPGEVKDPTSPRHWNV